MNNKKEKIFCKNFLFNVKNVFSILFLTFQGKHRLYCVFGKTATQKPL